MKTTFTTELQSFGNNVGIVVPSENLEELNAGKHPPVKVQVNEYEYQSTIASMSGQFLVPFAKEHRDKSGFKGGDVVTITLVLESKNRDLLVPEELLKVFEENHVSETFSAQPYSVRKEFIRQVVEAKKEETKIKRIQQIIDQLQLLKK
jgi:hypothetical protein